MVGKWLALTESEKVQELIEMLEIVHQQLKRCGNHTIVTDITYDSLEWVIDSAIKELNYLNSIRWDEY